MKSKNSIQSYLFTPFRYIAGTKSLIIGVIILLLLSVLGYWSHTFFDGALDAHYGCLTSPSLYRVHLLCILLSWISVTVVLYIAARIFSSSSVRLVDMAGTLAMAKWPMIFIALWGFVPSAHLCLEGINFMDTKTILVLVQENLFGMLLTALVAIVFAVWFVVLMYNAFSVSANLKGSRGVIIFIVGLVISEIISKILIYCFV